METEIDKSFRALIVSGNFQFSHYRMDDLALNMNEQYYGVITNFQIQS
ncbi:conserved hypothetical protein [Leuconostoc gasicomitatum]|nr:conserved hypothetical protein [Leuconostoc gasicomitatum]